MIRADENTVAVWVNGRRVLLTLPAPKPTAARAAVA